MPLRDAIAASGLRSGGTISFHHHLRNGDKVMVQALDACAALGLRDLHVAASSLFPVHAPLVPHIQSGVISNITTSYMAGPVADAVAQGLLPNPATLQTHGGRARAIERGELKIDLAVIAAPAVDAAGNLGGADGPNACGPLGYPMVDAAHAGHVLAVTDTRTDRLTRRCIPAEQVSQIARIDSIGDAGLIASGTTARPPSEAGRLIADLTARLIAASGLMENGMSFQTGAGATSLATARALAPLMAERNVAGGFACGGITGALVDMHRAGLFRELMDVQAFDAAGVASYRDDPAHHGISASTYANPDRDCIAHRLDVVVLGAAEIDLDFNVNVTTGSDGRIIGGSGGHADTAEGAKLTIITTPLRAGAFSKIVDKVRHVTTPGSTVNALVTEAGIALNDPELAERLRAADLPVTTIHDLWQQAGAAHQPPRPNTPIVAISDARDGSRSDVVHRLQAV